MKLRALLAICLMIVLILSACGTQNGESIQTAPSSDTAQTTAASETVTPTVDIDTSDMFTDRDLSADYDESAAALVQLNGDSAACDSDAVQIDGSTVTITDEGNDLQQTTRGRHYHRKHSN